MNCVHSLLINSMVLFKDGLQRNLYTPDIRTLRTNTLAFLLTHKYTEILAIYRILAIMCLEADGDHYTGNESQRCESQFFSISLLFCDKANLPSLTIKRRRIYIVLDENIFFDSK